MKLVPKGKDQNAGSTEDQPLKNRTKNKETHRSIKEKGPYKK